MNKDILIKMALELDPKDLFNLCLSSKKFNDIICNNENFWYQKLRKDMPNVENYSNYKEIANSKTYKQAYKNLFSNIIDLEIVIQGVKEDSDEVSDEVSDEDEKNREYVRVSVYSELEFKFTPLEEIKKKIFEIIRDYIQTSSYYGYYIIEIDDDLISDYTKMHFLDNKFDTLTYGFHNIKITLITDEFLSEDGSEQDIFDDILKTYL